MESSYKTPRWCWIVVACSGTLGLGLMVHQALVSSATYDESAYLEIASEWWRTGENVRIARMGSPMTFFKLQAGLVFWAIGRGRLIDDVIANQATLLPMVRICSLWIWLLTFALTVGWSRRLYGPRAMAIAAILFTLSPNLLAHGALVTMEAPLVAGTTAMFLLFWRFLETGSRRAFAAGAAVGGLAFSCKFTTVLIPPILALIWVIDLWRSGERGPLKIARTVVGGMAGYGLILVAVNLLVTGFALLPLSERVGDHPTVPGSITRLVETPIPQDWVGFATQMRHQKNGGPSYLLGERRMTGWWFYYPVALAVKLPLACWLLLSARGLAAIRLSSTRRDWLFPLAIAAFLAVAMVGSKRNYGLRYLLPLAPLAVVWVSALAERRGAWRWILGVGLIGQGVAVASIHPHELTYFNVAAGGPIGGRRILADSNLDWGQGLISLAKIQDGFPSLTLFYFGDIYPKVYGIRAKTFLITANQVPQHMPAELTVSTRYVAVSASLQYGPWGPVGYFSRLDRLVPVAYTDDKTIAIYDMSPGQ